MKILLYFFVTLISTSVFAQSTLHPGKMGAGYYYLHSLSEDFSASAHTIYFSTGYTDISFLISNTRLPGEKKEFQDIGLSIGISSIKEGKRIIPTTNLSIGTAAENSVFISLGPSLAFVIIDEGNVRIYPEAGILLTVADSRAGIQADLTSAADLVIAFHLGKIGFLAFQPGYSISKSIHYFSLAGGISFLL